MSTSNDSMNQRSLSDQPSVRSKVRPKNLLTFALHSLGGLALLCVLVIGISSGLQERIYTFGNYLWPNYAELTLNSVSSTAPSPCESASFTQQEDLLLLDDLLGEEEQTDAHIGTTARSPCSNTRHELPNTTEQILSNDTELPPKTLGHAIKQLEQLIQSLNLWLTGQQSIILSLFILVSLISATWQKKHLSLSPDDQRTRVSLIAQILSNALICYACYEYAQHLVERNYLSDNAHAYWLLSIAFGLNLCLCLYYLILGQSDLSGTPIKGKRSLTQRLIQVLKGIPIYSWMILLSVGLDKERTDHELALLIGQMFEMPMIYLQIGLYIWLGMLIKHSRLAELLIQLVLCIIRKPVAVAISLVAFMAIPTAFTGASGIIILAMGGLIYLSLSRLPLRRQFTLAITAMTGSTGVVLSPSLLIVAIAFLNKEVTTNELFYWGSLVFVLTLTLLLVIVKLMPNPILTDDEAEHSEAQGATTTQVLKQLLPYTVFGAILILIFQTVLGLSFNEFSAPYFLLLLMFSLLLMENRANHVSTFSSSTKKISHALTESFEHSGAILLVMLCSYSLGNTSFDPGWINALPIADLSMTGTLIALVVLLILIGMILDPFGALILVSMTLAPFAYDQGINPIHFWMITLVAFELAYVTPPVAMNHLLTRQQVPVHEWSELTLTAEDKNNTGGLRGVYLPHERVILPILVLSSSLMMVTFMPLWFY